MNIAECGQHMAVIVIVDRHAVIALFPKVACAAEQAVEAHGGVPVQPVHDPRQFGGPRRLKQIMYVVAHDAQAVQFETELGPGPGDGVQQYIATFTPGQVERPVVAARGDMKAGVFRQLADGA